MPLIIERTQGEAYIRRCRELQSQGRIITIVKVIGKSSYEITHDDAENYQAAPKQGDMFEGQTSGSNSNPETSA